MYRAMMMIGTGLLLTACGGANQTPPTEYPTVGAGCMVGGCNNELCVDADTDAVSACVWQPAFACYQTATCRKQENGVCGWDQTAELSQCLQQANNAAPAGI